MSHKLINTGGKSQFGSRVLTLGLELNMPLIRFDNETLLLTVLLCQPLCTDAIADLYPAIVVALQFRTSCR